MRVFVLRALALAILLTAFPAHAQLGAGPGASNIPDAKDLVTVTPQPLMIPSGTRGEARVTIRVREGWHVNANPPANDYMIATEVTLKQAGGLNPEKAMYPPGRKQKLSFEEKPLLVYDQEFEVRVPVVAVAGTSPGKTTLKGTLGFQACNDQVCLAPTQVPFELVVTVGPPAPGSPPLSPTAASKGGAGTPGATQAPGGMPPAPPAGAPAAGSGFTTAPPVTGAGSGAGSGASSALLDNPIARLFAGGSLAAFFGLFVIGLALNLTPCVYPMLGVTVSIFGARRAAPPMQVFGLALVYVLGMATMYSTLGVVAALTGGLFGAALQSPIVLFVIGALLAALAFSMFGFYEVQAPAWIRERAGGASASNLAGIFLSGLVVGVIAAPCVGPPVVALLALVGAKGDPWFGFQSFFTLAMGLGAPYLVLGTFSNLLQRMPRSGEWMEWVKKVFGVIMLSVGLFYISLAVAPKAQNWILPSALIAGGVYLGFIGRGAGQKPAFRLLRAAVGVLGVVGGIAVIATAPRQAMVFEVLDEQALAATLAGGKPALLDFTADWCAPCHELERFTFSDKRVQGAIKGFRAFRADLTKFQSPETERLKSRYDVHGVPTVLFLAPDGSEVRAARVEGFLTPEQFLERVRIAQSAGERAAK
jgi:thiol:disulfide interchange protein DsbD